MPGSSRILHAEQCFASTPGWKSKKKEVVASGNQFFAHIESFKDHFDPRLVFNVDEFFVRQEDNVSWTWERIEVGENRIIAIKNEKMGFTASALTSMDGTIDASPANDLAGQDKSEPRPHVRRAPQDYPATP
eukprot:PhM_4_TR18045/c2_g2_i5/m.97327